MPDKNVVSKVYDNFDASLGAQMKNGVVDLGERKLKIVAMPAQTHGYIVVLDIKVGSCFAGDAFEQLNN